MSESTKNSSDDVLDQNLLKKFNLIMDIPVPKETGEWTPKKLNIISKRNFISNFLHRKKIFTDEELSELRSGVFKSPGATRNTVLNYLKEDPTNSELIMLSAISNFNMLTNTTNSEKKVISLKHDTKQAITVMNTDQLNVFNFENFLSIYIALLERLNIESARLENDMPTSTSYESIKTQVSTQKKKLMLC